MSLLALRVVGCLVGLLLIFGWLPFGIELLVSSDGDCKGFPWCEGDGAVWPISAAYLSLAGWFSVPIAIHLVYQTARIWLIRRELD